jgi:hypothetical protein
LTGGSPASIARGILKAYDELIKHPGRNSQRLSNMQKTAKANDVHIGPRISWANAAQARVH